MNFSKIAKKLVFSLAIIFMLVYCLLPLYFLINASFQPTDMAYKSPPVLYPKSFTLKNYINVFSSINLGRYLLNSAIAASGGTVLAIFSGSLAAFALSILKVRGRNAFLGLLIIIGYFPMVVVIYPTYLLVSHLNLLNNYLGLILPYAAFNLPLTTWIMSSHFEQLPDALYDSAVIDGANSFQVFYKIMLPLAAPAIATVTILDFIFCWNEYMFALTFMSDKSMYTITTGLSLISAKTTYQFPWGEVIAGTLIVSVPLVILVIFAQEKIISGLTAGALKS